MTETTVADDAKAVAEAEAKDGGAQAQKDEVERLLAEFREAKQDPSDKPEPKQTTDDAVEARLSRLEKENEALRLKQVKSSTETGIADAVNLVKGDLGLPEKLVRGLLQDEASKDPRFLNAFLARDENSEAWKTILRGKAAEWKQELGTLPNPDLTADREAIAASASRATDAPRKSQGPSDKELNAMSKEDFEDYYQKWISGGS